MQNITEKITFINKGEIIVKATGIVRRIDDLGRIVIPKEIRRSFRIKEGDPLEIYTDAEGEVIFKKYSPIGELSNFASQYAEVLHKNGGLPIAIVDNDHVIAASGLSKREVLEQILHGFRAGISFALPLQLVAVGKRNPFNLPGNRLPGFLRFHARNRGTLHALATLPVIAGDNRVFPFHVYPLADLFQRSSSH